MKHTDRILFEARRAGTEGTEYSGIESMGLYAVIQEECEMEYGKLVTVSLQNRSDTDFLGVIHIKVSIEEKDPDFYMPGYMYGNNTADMPNHGRKEFPRIQRGAEKRPESEFFMTRSDRLAEPVSLIYDSGRVVGIAAAPYWVGTPDEKREVDLRTERYEQGTVPFYQYSGFTCRIGEAGRSSVGYTLGYENAPWLFIQTATVLERAPLTGDNAFLLKTGEEVHVSLRLYDFETENELGIHKALKDVYEVYHQEPRKIDGMDVKKAVTLLSNAIRDYAWLPEEKMYTGFVYDREDGLAYNKIGSLSWTNGLSVACPMLLAANRLSDETMRGQALTFIEEVVAYSLNPSSGLLYDAVSDGVWSERGWWYSGMHSGGHSAYINGQAVYYILKSYISEKEQKGICHEEWIRFVSPVILRFNQLKNTDAEYPFSMSVKTGAGLEYDSLGSCWCLTATALYAQITGDFSMLEGMKQSEQHYYDVFVKKMNCYGGPLDTDKAVDDEGILAYVRAARILHEITEEEKYLEHLRNGLYYEVSFKLGYNTPVQVRPLCDIGWSSCGGSITSVANPHIHPMSNTVVDEMFYLVEKTNDEYIRNRLSDTIFWGMQTFNTFEKEYGHGKTGWMSERFCFCQGLVTEKYPDGTPAGTWFALMPWASASIIEGFVGKCWMEE